jgi:hypothetical protein
MKFVYLESCKEDLKWIRKYYQQVFPEGDQAAVHNFKIAKNLITSQNFVGVEFGFGQNVRKLKIAKTPFSMIYRIKKDRIEVLRVLDERTLKN